MSMPAVQAFDVVIPDSAWSDLRDRVEGARWPVEPDDAGWQYGIPLDYLKALTSYWVNDFDWPAAQAAINEKQHLHISLPLEGGEHIVVHVEKTAAIGSDDKPPILLTAGWPSCFLEYRHVTEALARSGRTVYVADLPGFGLSAAPPRPLDPRQMARMWRNMMVDVLGHSAFVVQGGDWGSVVASWLGVDHADVVKAVSLTMLGLKPAFGPDDPPLCDEEKAWLKEMQKRLSKDSGYREVQATKPTTLAVGLVDSPVAVAAWLAEKYIGWSGGLDNATRLTFDEILVPISLYWYTGNIASANWIYWADRNIGGIGLEPGQKCSVPTGFGFFDQGFFPFPPDAWVNRAYNMVDRENHDLGGHFPAWTQPELFTQNLLGFLGKEAGA